MKNATPLQNLIPNNHTQVSTRTGSRWFLIMPDNRCVWATDAKQAKSFSKTATVAYELTGKSL